VRLAGLLVELMPDEPECHGLLALLVSTRARAATRVDESGLQVLLADADRSLWDHDAIESAVAMVERALRAGRVGSRQLRAAISCLHSVAPSTTETDWPQIVQLYNMLVRVDPSPAVRVNRAVAVAEVDGPQAALVSLEGITGVDDWHLFHAVRADLLRRLGDDAAAADALEAALACPHNDVDDRLLRARLAELRLLS
jgi:RNA polymerase sigma-70 factor, ECF subfamily